MRALIGMTLVCLSPWPVLAQEGFEADRLQPCLALPGLIATCRAQAQPGQLALAAGLDWTQHLLALVPNEGVAGTDWLVEQRLSLRMEATWAPAASILVVAGLDGVAHQTGQVTDARGARVGLGPAMGRTWLGGIWVLPRPGDQAELGLQARLVLPTADRQGLAGPDRVEWQLSLLASARVWWLQGLLNLGLAFGQTARYRDLIRDEALTYRAGLELAGPDWPLAMFVEIAGVTRLEAPFARRSDQTIEALAGLRLVTGERFELLVAGGAGLLGPSAPTGRAMTLLRVRLGPEKRLLAIE